MAQASNTSAALSPPEVAVSRQKWRWFLKGLESVRDALRSEDYENTIQDIQAAFGCGRRTAERIYAGQRVGAEQHFAALTHPEHGAAYLETVLRNVPAENRARLSEQLMLAAKLVWLEEEQQTIAKKVRR